MPDCSNLHIQMNFILPNIQNFPQIVWKYMLNPNTGKIDLKPNNFAQVCLHDTPETNSWWYTRQKFQPLFRRVYK